MSILHPTGQNRLLDLEQELLRQRSHDSAFQRKDEPEWQSEQWPERYSDTGDEVNESEWKEPAKSEWDDWDEAGSGFEPDVYQALLNLERAEVETPAPDRSTPEAFEFSTDSLDQSAATFSYTGLATLLTAPNRQSEKAIAHQTITAVSDPWTDSTELEFDSFAPTTLPSASRSQPPQPDAFASPDVASSIAPPFSLPDLELPEPDSPDDSASHFPASEPDPSSTEPSYATLSWMLQEGRHDYPTSNKEDGADELFLAIAQTIDIEAEAIARDQAQAFE